MEHEATRITELYDAWYEAFQRELAAQARLDKALQRCWNPETRVLTKDADYERQHAEFLQAQDITEAALSALPEDHSEAQAEELIEQAERRWQLKHTG